MMLRVFLLLLPAAAALGQSEYLEERIRNAQEGRAHSLEWLYLAEIGELDASIDFDAPEVQREVRAIRALDWRFGHLLDQAEAAYRRGDYAEAEAELAHALEVEALLRRRSLPLIRPEQ